MMDYSKSKVLIYANENDLKPIGGSNGYLYYLRQGLCSKKDSIIDVQFLEGPSHNTKNFHTNISFIDKAMGAIYHRMFYSSLFSESGTHTDNATDFNQFDIVHFHAPLDIFKLRDSLKTYTGKVLLTTHSPIPYHQEIMSHMNKCDRIVMGKYYNILSKMDEYAFNRADYLVFPCIYAEEAYLSHWPEYSKIKENSNYKYILSGITQCRAVHDRETIRKRYNIPVNQFVFCYVGRHNEVKGYLDLKTIGEAILRKYPNAWFLIAGKEGPITRLVNDRWIEVGWTKDPHSIIASSDIFILPNRETYFDLVMLEVLSLGIPVIASYTGGNKVFKDLHADGVMLYSSIEEGISLCEKAIQMDRIKIEKMKKSNKNIYNRYFTTEIFSQNYIDIYKSILEE